MRNTRSAGLAQAENLADMGDLAAAVRLLTGASMDAEAAALVDERVLRLLGRHEHGDLVRAVDALPPGHRSPLAKLACLDAKVLSGQADTAQLNDLIEQASRSGQSDLASFGTAIMVEHLIVHSDPMAFLLAMQQLTALPQDPLPGTMILVARARLLRACALARLFLGPAGYHDAEADRSSAVADFNRAGWQVDRWLTTAAFHLVRAGVNWAATPADRFATLEARDQLIAAGSEQVPWARYAVAMTAFSHGDITAVQTEVDLISRSSTDRMPFLRLLADHLDALITLALLPAGQSADAAVDRLAQIVDRVRHEYPIFIGPMLVQTAHALIDAGRADDALAWFGRVQAVSPLLAHEELEREVMACRLALLHGHDHPLSHERWGDDAWAAAGTGTVIADRLESALTSLVTLGHVPMARSMALRSAVTARRTGSTELAVRLLTWARANTAGTGSMTWWDVRAERQATGWINPSPSPAENRPFEHGPDESSPVESSPVESSPAENGPVAGSLRLLAPGARIEVNGQPRRLAPALLRLVAVLGALERPVGTEQLIELLWPGADPAAGRGRLKSAHHRLRQSLAPAAELVRRDGDVWSLDATGAWAVDLTQFQRLAAGDRADRLMALRLPAGLLWHVQFPYDEALAERRSWLEARWLNLAQELTGTGDVHPDEIRELADRLGLADPSP